MPKYYLENISHKATDRLQFFREEKKGMTHRIREAKQYPKFHPWVGSVAVRMWEVGYIKSLKKDVLTAEDVDYSKSIMSNTIIDRTKEIQEKLYFIRADHQGYLGNSFVWVGKDNKGYTVSLNKAHQFTLQEFEDMKKSLKGKKISAYPVNYMLEIADKVADSQNVDSKKRIA